MLDTKVADSSACCAINAMMPMSMEPTVSKLYHQLHPPTLQELIMNPAKVVLITGCSSGFGRLMAETLARKHYQVFATMRALQDRNANAAHELRALAERESLPLHVLELDVTDDASVERAVADALAQAGRIDVLVNNAGYLLLGLAETATLEQAKRIMETNFFGVVRMDRAVLPHMRRQGSGLLVHMSSVAGRLGIPGMGFYNASKFALEALAETYRYELAAQGIDSVLVEPGPYATAGFEKREETADQSRAATYGPANEIPKSLLGALNSSKANPQEAVDAVVNLMELPAGNRPLRVPIGTPALEGLGGLNYICEQYLKNLLVMIGLGPLTVFESHAGSAD
jgi:NAD(P)-dependent dehydrogenase (short-subunit alcohol dehydrogenase family)